MNAMICSYCGTNENVKPAWEYAELIDVLDAWKLLEQAEAPLLCPVCADSLIGEMGMDSVKIPPLDFLDVGDVVDEL